MQSYDNPSEILPLQNLNYWAALEQHIWNKKYRKKVLKLAKEQEKTLEEQTGVALHEWQRQQVEQENIQDYIAEVLAEVEKSREKQEE